MTGSDDWPMACFLIVLMFTVVAVSTVPVRFEGEGHFSMMCGSEARDGNPEACNVIQNTLNTTSLAPVTIDIGFQGAVQMPAYVWLNTISRMR